ncbi:DUF4097 family beta strand repeat-containing protein [Spirilliplanes yamanashiensis]|uniref:DUF4097 domain-containing protein n=1 Tax=Spirilliplanes yamanashiensis TaxID=42233 RepID=A0A8J4DK69_9ACTN|nr:DUF4097 family beta strand repeat-containing protein [Spirilliplanes yamanashiensis]MDP9815496.1 hypothetical protein [Spirilliplanes yamanashiensis]GIJ03750.1 hypothetical protein Sya03_31020 [Spirilliplanes yamanashiensis]
MPVYATPEPISVTLELYVAAVRIVASDRADTHVEVSPSNPADDSDVQAAQATRVEYADGVLTLRNPRSVALNFTRKSRSVDVLIELPAGSAVQGDLMVGHVRGTGVLGECRIKTSVGQVKLDRTGPLRVKTTGDIDVEAVAGGADAATGSGRVRIGEVAGPAVIKNANGAIDIGTVTGDLRARTANGAISVDRADAAVEVRSSNGNVRVGRVTRDAVSLHTAAGDVEVGVAAGTAAWLDLKTSFGRVHNALDEIGQAPENAERTVEVRAQTSFGDITVRRS